MIDRRRSSDLDRLSIMNFDRLSNTTSDRLTCVVQKLLHRLHVGINYGDIKSETGWSQDQIP